MPVANHNDQVKKYYNRSRWGYGLVMRDSQHFGYHPEGQPVSEWEAQQLMQDQIAIHLNLKAGDKVLDAGCGRGVVAIYLAAKTQAEIFGVDIVPFEIDKAKQLARKSGVEQFTYFDIRDYTQTQLGDASFDAVYTMETLSHAQNLDAALGEFWRVLKKQGRCVFFEYTLEPEAQFSPYEQQVLEAVIEGSSMTGLWDFRVGNFEKKLAKAGFTQITNTDISWRIEPSLRRLRNWAYLPYALVKLCSRQKAFPNLTAAVEFHKLGHKGLVHYNIFSAQKA